MKKSGKQESHKDDSQNGFDSTKNDDLSFVENESMEPRFYSAEYLREPNEEMLVALFNNAATTKTSHLQLSSIHMEKIPSQIRQLTSVREINLSFNILKSIPPEIGLLKKLRRLDLTSNQLVSIPPDIGKLKKLYSLGLAVNQLGTLPDDIGELVSLQELLLASNKLTSLPSQIGHLRNLIRLTLSNNYLHDFPPELCQLTELRELIFGDNYIRTLPSCINQLSNLEVLWLENNQIRHLPPEIRLLTNLKELKLEGNPLPIPPEILGRTTEPRVILDYYFTRRKRPINESKLSIVGESGVGKTSLAQQIIHGTFDQHNTKTEGISIQYWQVEGDERGEINEQSVLTYEKPEIKLNIWDFGGQEIMHATHQFFFTKRSLYLLVLDSHLTREENRVEYWLKIIQSFGGEAPVLIVGNKIDQHPLDIDRTGLQKKYRNIVGILETSAATGAGIEELKAAITKQVNNLSHVRDLLPETWFTVKTKLEELGKQSNFITHDKYLDLCAENEVSDETSQRTLIGFLHDLGVVLHFQDDPRLEALGILNPQWVTNGVYKILNAHALFQNKGVLTVSRLDEVLNLPEYPRGKRLFIVDMMKKFELCYDIEPDKTFLVPDLLPKDETDGLKFDGIPAFEYTYPVLPSSVITRFIVRMNQHIHASCVWRTGVLLKIGKNTALVKADIEDRKITIAIAGLEHTRRDALSAIRYQLDEIHTSIKGLDAQKRVPIPNAPNAEPLEYEYLLMLEREGQETHLVKDGSRLVKINVREVLSGIESETQRRDRGGTVTNIYVGGNFDGNLTVGDGNQSITDSYNKITSAKINPELKQTLKLLTEAVSAMTKAMADEQVAEVTEDLGKLVDEATKLKPNKKWYSVSIDGLIKAAENVEKVGEPVINLSRKVLSLLLGEMVK